MLSFELIVQDCPGNVREEYIPHVDEDKELLPFIDNPHDTNF